MYYGELRGPPEYTRVAETMNCSEALVALKQGHQVAREGWNGKSMWINMQRPDMNSKMTLPYIYMYTAQGDRVPWLASQTDILADDWVRVY